MTVLMLLTGDRCIVCYRAMVQSHTHEMLLAKPLLILLQVTGVLRLAESK